MLDASSARIAFGPFVLDLVRGELLRAGELVALAPKPLAVLAYLAANRDRSVPKHELLKQVWPDVYVSEAAFASALKDLRRAIGDDGARQSVIRTLRRRGYRFVAKLATASPQERARAPRDRRGAERPKRVPFVARARELRSLSGLAGQAARGKPRLAVLVGEPGAGKTRLLEQLLEHPACAELAHAVGRCQAEAPLPYLPFAEALSFRVDESDDPADRVFGDDASILRPLLQPDMPAAAPDDRFGHGNAPRDRADLFAAVFGLLARLARNRPTLVAIEDLHEADSASLALLADLVAAISDARRTEPLPLFLVVTTRPPRAGERLEEVLRRVQQSPVATTLAVEGLGVGATRRFLDSLGVQSTRASVRQIHGETGGNPLLIRAVARLGGASRARDAEAGGAPVPPGDAERALRQAVAARVAGVGRSCRAALTAAAFIGERFGAVTLGAVCGRDPKKLAADLAEAVRAELVVGERHSFRFDHPLVCEVLRDATPPRERRALHRDIAAVLQELYVTSRGEHALEIAHHLVEAGDLVPAEQVFDFARRAGEQAYAVCAWHEASYFHAAAVRAAAQLPARDRALQHLRAGLAANHDFDVRGCLEHYAAAAQAFDEAQDDVGLAWSLMYLTRARFTFPTGPRVAEDLAPLEELLARFGETHPSLRARLLGTISEAHWTAGRVELAQSSAERAVAIANLYDDAVGSYHGLFALGLAQLSQLRARDALESWLESVAHARRAHDPWLQATGGVRVSLALLHLGRLEEARDRARAAAELAARAHHTSEVGLAQATLAGIEVACGAFGEARQAVDAALSALQRSSYPWAGLYALCARASSATHRGVWREAADALAELVTPGRVFADPGPSVRFTAAAYGALVAAQRDGGLEPGGVAALAGSLRGARLDPHLLGGVCAIAEACEAIGDPALAKRPEEMLRSAHDHGIAFTTGWVFLIPRVIGRLAWLDGRWHEAESWLDRALATARGSGARVELALALVDRARVRGLRRDGGRDEERALRDLDEAVPLLEELGLGPAHRSALLLRRTLRGAPQFTANEG